MARVRIVILLLAPLFVVLVQHDTFVRHWFIASPPYPLLNKVVPTFSMKADSLDETTDQVTKVAGVPVEWRSWPEPYPQTSFDPPLRNATVDQIIRSVSHDWWFHPWGMVARERDGRIVVSCVVPDGKFVLAFHDLRDLLPIDPGERSTAAAAVKDRLEQLARVDCIYEANGSKPVTSQARVWQAGPTFLIYTDVASHQLIAHRLSQLRKDSGSFSAFIAERSAAYSRPASTGNNILP